MRALLQRVTSASVTVGGRVTGEIGAGLLVLLGIHRDDSEEDGAWIAKKILECRIFPDADGKMNRSVTDIGGGILVVSQFTLYGDLAKGTRPSFTESMPGAAAREFYAAWMQRFRAQTVLNVAEGEFAAEMKVALVNDGPVTIWIDSK